ncbi:YHYH protein [Paraglaciecola agarilytica]|uniref:YHYH protein n=1 Tax=Paraglaciecola chathamensis TaxID=368405 RepID=UPI001C09E0D3|nr:YHYH protein [Paraglaciecola agarilytica]MBU3018095.1 YHYH protein [Paraglaciecola agarilytica]
MTRRHTLTRSNIYPLSADKTRMLKALRFALIALAAPLAISACGDDSSSTQKSTAVQSARANASQVDIKLFSLNALAKQPEIVDCTLENGDDAQCAKLVVKYLPDEMEIGPFCPTTLDDKGGIWDWDGTKAGLYRLDKAFLTMLSEQGYIFYDEDGTVHVVDNATSRPTVDHACIQVSEDQDVKITVLIPTTPVMADKATPMGVVSKVGIALAGVPIFSDAPSVQHTGHLPALDTCAGHVDPGGWYHYHGTSSDIDSVYAHEHVDAKCSNLPQDPAGLFGYAFDGVPIYGSVDANNVMPTDLDECNGHTGLIADSGVSAYHYHSTNEFPNLPKCLKGVVAKNNFSTTAQAGVGARPPEGTNMTRNEPPGGGRPGAKNMSGNGQMVPPGFADAAKKLGVSETQLMQAMDDAGGPQADLAKVAKALNVTEAELKVALPERPKR